MNNFWNNIYFGNSLLTWIIAVAGIVVGLAIIKILRAGLLKRLKLWSQKTKTNFDDFIVASFEESVIPVLFFLVIYAGSATLDSIVLHVLRDIRILKIANPIRHSKISRSAWE